MGAVVANLCAVLFIALCFALGAKRNSGVRFLAVCWIGVWLSVWGWIIYAIVHFVTKYW